jgi:hypothetical protein
MVSDSTWSFTLANKRNIHIIIFIISFIFCISCGTTHIYCPDSEAEIYMGNEFLGKGEAYISSLGPPNTELVMAKKQDQIIGAIYTSRDFTISTFGWGLITYYTGWYWGWYYPDEIFIPITNPVDSLKSNWDNTKESIWMKPIQKKKTD